MVVSNISIYTGYYAHAIIVINSLIHWLAGNIHPAIIRLGLQYASRVVCGSNARALALMNAMKIVISDYSSPADKELLRDLQDSLKPNITFLKQVSISLSIPHE